MATKTTKKKAAKKKAPAAAGTGKRGRVSAYAGKKIYKLVKTEETKLRETGKVRECWNAISDGIKVETYREKSGHHSLARLCLADFIAKGYVELKD